MAPTPPIFKSKLSVPMTANNFTPIQSVQISVSTTSSSKTFTVVPGQSTRTTFKISNSGTKGCYISTGITTATAVASSGTPTPTTGSAATCDYIGPGNCLTQDYVQGTDTIAAICAGSDSTVLEISIGYGQ